MLGRDCWWWEWSFGFKRHCVTVFVTGSLTYHNIEPKGKNPWQQLVRASEEGSWQGMQQPHPPPMLPLQWMRQPTWSLSWGSNEENWQRSCAEIEREIDLFCLLHISTSVCVLCTSNPVQNMLIQHFSHVFARFWSKNLEKWGKYTLFGGLTLNMLGNIKTLVKEHRKPILSNKTVRQTYRQTDR